jgi:hypothetical protein
MPAMRASLIAQQSVTDPNGRLWTIGIRWLPRPPRWIGWRPRRKKSEDRGWGWLDAVDPIDALSIGDELGPVAAIAAIIAMLLLLWFFVVPIAILVLDLLFVVLLAAGGVAARVLFRRPWIVEATTPGEKHQRPVVGYRASREVVEATARAIQLAGTLP